ncbi:MAG: 2-oxoacid:acceptor oxidoreductase family protein [Candidatus Omnitrophica bacterium]|nr:2-oxoacid:acceptor oxidoreductase family protein [Candidatus Omnitrophota bacterium]
MTQRIIISGSGGQGIMMLGKVLAQAAMREGKFVTFLPAYGAEVRGGTANCMVVISEEEIGSPVVEAADSLIVMNEPSLDRFACRLTKAGTIFINSSLVPAEKIKAGSVAFPFTGIAMNLGNQRAANMVALGVFCGQSKIVSVQTVTTIISESAPADKKEQAGLNIKALEAGNDLIKTGRGRKNG